MSFLDSVLSSIDTGKPPSISPATTPRTPISPISSTTAKAEARKPSTGVRDAAERKPVTAGTKRKAEEQLRRPAKPSSEIPGKPAPSRPIASRPAPSRPAPTPASAPKSRLNTASSAKLASNGASAPQKAAPVSSKPPPKGSFADIMAQAKAAQTKAPTQVGMFKHQSAPKERLSKAERKRRELEAQKNKDPRAAKKGAQTSATPAVKAGDGKPIKKREPVELEYKGTARPSQPVYRGTAGLPASRNAHDRKQQSGAGRRRADEYLGTDEEDEGDYADDYDDYYSESSDMEAGLDDVEDEEAAALKSARREDEEELRAEMKAKQEKLERRKKLSALASSRR